jgi:hypothetical protein
VYKIRRIDLENLSEAMLITVLALVRLNSNSILSLEA